MDHLSTLGCAHTNSPRGATIVILYTCTDRQPHKDRPRHEHATRPLTLSIGDSHRIVDSEFVMDAYIGPCEHPLTHGWVSSEGVVSVMSEGSESAYPCCSHVDAFPCAFADCAMTMVAYPLKRSCTN